MFDQPADRSQTQPGEHRTAVVTGGAKRLGRELAVALARHGYNVAITFRDSATEAHETKTAIEALGVQSLAVPCDVRNEGSVRQAVASVVHQFGELNLLVNNAAVFTSANLGEMSLAQWDEAFETNTRGPFLMAREALPYLKAARGRIIHIGSLGGSHPWAAHAHYCSSKAALHMLTQTMAKAFAPEVSVNCVAPGWIQFGEATEVAARFARKTPMARNATAADVAEAVLFFATRPHFITGQILAVDGGLGLA
jgi:NAD(P)-dependent dehydrogenase (short-subunit alcohol dehydrogenase family)